MCPKQVISINLSVESLLKLDTIAMSSLQLFLHKVFGYRGVVLFHWVSKVYDRDKQEARTRYLLQSLTCTQCI